MIITIKTLPKYYPEIFAIRILISILILFGLCVLSVVLYRNGKINIIQLTAVIVLSVYVVILLYFTVFGRYSHDEYTYQIYIFKSYRDLFEKFDWQSIRQIIINIAMMIPVGFLLSVLMKNKYKYLFVLISILGLILFIESMQLLMHCGTFEVDDIINNLLGAFLGMLLYRIATGIVNKLKKSKGNHYE